MQIVPDEFGLLNLLIYKNLQKLLDDFEMTISATPEVISAIQAGISSLEDDSQIDKSRLLSGLYGIETIPCILSDHAESCFRLLPSVSEPGAKVIILASVQSATLITDSRKMIIAAQNLISPVDTSTSLDLLRTYMEQAQVSSAEKAEFIRDSSTFYTPTRSHPQWEWWQKYLV